MTPEDGQDAIRSATEESRERAGARSGDAANRPGDGPPLESDDAGASDKIDGAADTGPGTHPEGATPKVSKSGDPLADAHD
jgi:hypothetical protein